MIIMCGKGQSFDDRMKETNVRGWWRESDMEWKFGQNISSVRIMGYHREKGTITHYHYQWIVDQHPIIHILLHLPVIHPLIRMQRSLSTAQNNQMFLPLVVKKYSRMISYTCYSILKTTSSIKISPWFATHIKIGPSLRCLSEMYLSDANQSTKTFPRIKLRSVTRWRLHHRAERSSCCLPCKTFFHRPLTHSFLQIVVLFKNMFNHQWIEFPTF